MMNRPNATQAPISGANTATAAWRSAGSVPDKASMMWPNRTGSMNCAIASTMLASANAPASRASGASRSSTRT